MGGAGHRRATEAPPARRRDGGGDARRRPGHHGPGPGRRGATPTSSALWETCKVTLNGVSTTVDKAGRTRTVVNGTGGSGTVVGFFVRTDGACRFKRILKVDGRVGYNGISNGLTRRQGSGTTPAGTYTMTESFGNSPRPMTALSYRRVTAGDYWIQDQNSLFYNTLRNSSLGGFLATTLGSNGSARLLDYTTQYAHAVVINFNRAPDSKVVGRGSESSSTSTTRARPRAASRSPRRTCAL